MKKLINIVLLLTIPLLIVALDLKDFQTDINNSSIDLSKVLPGGPGKDGIPAINSPKFVKIKNSKQNEADLGLFVNIGDVKKFYPFNILVWHEIVNDKILDNYISVTFCPLCGSGIVFNREINGEVHKFGVSGYLYESNLLMYDNRTESLWSQSRGEAVVGKYRGIKLDIFPVTILDIKTVKSEYPDALILSKNTGFSRNYNFYPYGDYENNKKLYFPTTSFSDKFHPKEVMYVFNYKNSSYTFPLKELDGNGLSFELKDSIIHIDRVKSEIIISVNKTRLPGYYEMWFSWYIHNSSNGTVLE